MSDNNKKLLLVGCGKLGSVLLKSWLAHKNFDEIVVVQPSLSIQEYYENHLNLSFVKSHTCIPADFVPDVIVIAVKPNQLSDLLPYYAHYRSASLFVSLVTGISVSHLHEKLGDDANVVRLMPNIAVLVGQSVNLAYSTSSLPSIYRDLVHKIFECTGQLIWLDHEASIDALTPISGSGPAYFFLLTEILAKRISKHGIDKSTSLKIANQILLGSALLTTKDPDVEKLRSSVTSKGGVTEAAFKVLQPQLSNLMEEALTAAMNRLKELSGIKQ